ncbi:hypothetical protein QCA50_017781 [Cerrena zonata]|uniref:Uncharacterized protein n=1 Tax=Cerrena zonata TaxID=2478898 RepID=A0AAW0FNT8_9APHY
MSVAVWQALLGRIVCASVIASLLYCASILLLASFSCSPAVTSRIRLGIFVCLIVSFCIGTFHRAHYNLYLI